MINEKASAACSQFMASSARSRVHLGRTPDLHASSCAAARSKIRQRRLLHEHRTELAELILQTVEHPARRVQRRGPVYILTALCFIANTDVPLDERREHPERFL